MKHLTLFILLSIPFVDRAQHGWLYKTDPLGQELAKHKEEDTVRAKLLIYMANVYRHNEANESLKYGQKALKLCKRLEYRRGEAAAYNNMGLANEGLRQYDEALECDQASLAIDSELHDMHGIGGSLCNMGVVYTDKREYAKAVELLMAAKGALETIPGANDTDEYLANTYMSIGWTYLRMTKMVSADKMFVEGLRIYERAHLNDQVGFASLNIASTRFVAEQYDDATFYANKALAIAKEENNATGVEQANKLLKKINENAKK